MSLAYTSTCTLCGEYSHRTSKCYELTSDLKEGFYTGAGASGGHDEDECHFKVSRILQIDVRAYRRRSRVFNGSRYSRP